LQLRDLEHYAQIFIGAKRRKTEKYCYSISLSHNIQEAGHLYKGLDFEGAVLDVISSALFLKSLGCKKVGVTGFCMGGALAIAAMASTDQIAAGCPFYGIPDLTKINLAKI